MRYSLEGSYELSRFAVRPPTHCLHDYDCATLKLRDLGPCEAAVFPYMKNFLVYEERVMNQTLREILDTGIVWDGSDSLPLHDNMSEEDCGLITEAIKTVKPQVSLEIGFGCGISTLFACDALAANSDECKHIIIDPHQNTIFRNIGLQNVRRAGYEYMIELYETPSELALPRLLAEGDPNSNRHHRRMAYLRSCAG
jgi:hypothetical protein